MRKSRPKYEAKMRLKKGDEVVVLSGKDSGKRGQILEVRPDEGRVVVDGINVHTRHRKSRATSQKTAIKDQMGEMQVALPVPVGKVKLVCPKCNEEVRVGKTKSEDGKSARICKKCNELLDD